MKKFCVVSHTHWDREWYQPFEQFRFRLVKLIDSLLDIMEKQPDYIFHLDAQTIVLEDYLEIRPDRKDSLCRYIKEGRILVGPWYVQNDFFLSAGESTVRNLQLGIDIAKSFGRCGKVGYCPDQFGIIGQLPQILKSFGIDTFVFGRGYNPIEKSETGFNWLHSPSEFEWSGADGSRVTAINMRYWYNNAQRFSENIDNSMQLVKSVDNNFNGIASTPYLLLMNGVDHLEPQENLLPILKIINQKLLTDQQIMQVDLEDYIREVIEYVNDNHIELYKVNGELREGCDDQILQGTLSSRPYLKQANKQCENMLLNCLEPMQVMVSNATCGHDQSYDIIKYLWKSLIPNHAHDSICGCSIDAVHGQMMDRFERIKQAGNSLKLDLMDFLGRYAKLPLASLEDRMITIFNGTQQPIDGWVDAEVYFHSDEHVPGFVLQDVDGKIYNYEILSKDLIHLHMTDPVNLPSTSVVERYGIRIRQASVAPLCVKHLLVKASETCKEATIAIPISEYMIENDYYRIEADGDGILNLDCKDINHQANDFLYIEDVADLGHSYNFYPMPGDIPITSYGKVKEIVCIKDACGQSMTIRYDLLLPEKNQSPTQRSSKLVTSEMAVTFRLDEGSPMLYCKYTLTNRSKDHRLRLILNTGIVSTDTYSSSAFEMVKRPFGYGVVKDMKNGSQPNQGIICVQDNNGGLAVFNNGLYEYEHISSNGIIGITVARATGVISCGREGHFDESDIWQHVPDNQLLHTSLQGQIAIFAYKENFRQAEVWKHHVLFENPPAVFCSGINPLLYKGGRTTVQASATKEIFIKQDMFKDVSLNENQPLFQVEDINIIISSVKQETHGVRVIVRMFNLAEEPVKTLIKTDRIYSQCHEINLAEENIRLLPFSCQQVKCLFKPKEIKTIAFKR